MNISEFINLSDDKARARRMLAAKLGVSEVTVRSWANGNRSPRRKLLKAIVLATDGKVTIDSLIDDDDKGQADA